MKETKLTGQPSGYESLAVARGFLTARVRVTNAAAT